MQFIADPAIFEHFPGMSLALVIADGVNNENANKRLRYNLFPKMSYNITREK